MDNWDFYCNCNDKLEKKGFVYAKTSSYGNSLFADVAELYKNEETGKYACLMYRKYYHLYSDDYQSIYLELSDKKALELWKAHDQEGYEYTRENGTVAGGF